jgi:hypothetical protein
MRHALPPSAVSAAAQGMSRTTPVAGLVAPACLALPLSARFPSTTFVAVDLAAITTPTDQHLCPAPATQKEPANLSVLTCGRGKTRTRPATMLPRHPFRRPPVVICAARCRSGLLAQSCQYSNATDARRPPEQTTTAGNSIVCWASRKCDSPSAVTDRKRSLATALWRARSLALAAPRAPRGSGQMALDLRCPRLAARFARVLTAIHTRSKAPPHLNH